MALSILTDSERKAYEDMNMTTRAKFDAVIKKYGIDKIPAEITAMRKEMDKQRGRGRGLWQALWAGLGTVKKQGDELFKE
jgi:hypothetical protein